MFRRYILLIVAVPLFAAGDLAQSGRPGAPSAPKALIGFLRKKQYADRYGCTYSVRGGTRTIFFDEALNGGPEALMRIDGQDVRVKYVGAARPLGGRVRTGQREVLHYAAPGIKVKVIRFTGREVGSGVNYSGTITVSKGNRRQVARFTGWCGA